MIGEQVHNYLLKALLGRGGMGSVYLAEHVVIGHQVAVKVLKRELCDDKVQVARFLNEARAAHAIRHPNIIEVMDAGTLPTGVPYIVTELLEGESLARRLAGAQPLPAALAIDIAVQTTLALGAAHAVGIVHRDLKPDNVFLVPDPERPSGVRVKVLDFGIAKLRGDLGDQVVKTVTGSLMGTPQYMAPEQCRAGADAVDHRADVYALGIILYEMVCGGPPFASAGFGEVMMLHMATIPDPPRTRNPAVPPALEATIMRALAKRPDERFADMAELRRALTGEVEVKLPSQPRLAPLTPGLGVRETKLLTPDHRAEATRDGKARTPSGTVLEQPRHSTTLSDVASEMGRTPVPRLRRLIVPVAGVLGLGALGFGIVRVVLRPPAGSAGDVVSEPVAPARAAGAPAAPNLGSSPFQPPAREEAPPSEAPPAPPPLVGPAVAPPVAAPPVAVAPVKAKKKEPRRATGNKSRERDAPAAVATPEPAAPPKPVSTPAPAPLPTRPAGEILPSEPVPPQPTTPAPAETPPASPRGKRW